jgi:hypothetical protein
LCVFVRRSTEGLGEILLEALSTFGLDYLEPIPHAVFELIN